MENSTQAGQQAKESILPIPEAYTSNLFQKGEIENIFLKKWLMAGRIERIPDSGDYFTTDLLEKNIVVINDNGTIKAYFNTCPHRGMRLCAGSGNNTRITCPYHGWSFDKDGSLISHPGVSKNDLKFDSGNYSLQKIKCESKGGFIWVNFDNDCSTLKDQIGDFTNRILSLYDTKNLYCFKYFEEQYNSNWKLYLEAGMEGLHIPHVHKNSIGKQKLEHHESKGDWQLLIQPSNKTSSLPPRSNFETLNKIPTLHEDDLKTSFCLVYPNLFIVATLDSVWWAQTWPIESGKSIVKFGFCVSPHEQNKDYFHERIKNYENHWHKVINEDRNLVEEQQKGIINSKSIFYTQQEVEVEKFHSWVGKCVPSNYYR